MVDVKDLIERLERLAKIARRALVTNKTLSVWSADPETLELAAEALSRLSVERDELKAKERESFQNFVDANEARIEAERQRDEAIERAAKVADECASACENTVSSMPSTKLKHRAEGMAHGAKLVAKSIRSLNSPGGA